ncbi:BatA domain-containing protein [bacterium]|nr:BatA domain-containing protein [bacterium]
MLSFLNNFFLPILLAASLPILIHLLSRRRIKRVKFSTLRFIKELQKHQMRRIKLRQILLLIIRTLIILFIVAAFARPAIKGAFTADIQAHEPTSVAILLDNSYSMGQESKGVDLFTQARAKAHQIIEFLKSGDECILIVFNDEPQPITREPTRLFSQLESVLDTIEVSDKGTDVYEALGMALKMLSDSKLLHKELYILTDNKEPGWREWSQVEVGERTRIFVVPFAGDYKDNQAIEQITFPNQLLEIKKPIHLSVSVHNYSPHAVGGILTSIFLDGNRVAQKDIDLLSNSSGKIDAQMEVMEGGNHWGYAEIEGDAILTDNKHYFSFKIPERVKTLLVGEENTLFVKLALNPEGNGFFDIKEIDYKHLGGEFMTKYDIILLLDPPSLPPEIFTKLVQFIKQGGGVFLTIGENSDIENLKDNFLKEFQDISITERIGNSGTKTYLQLEKLDYNHPIFQIFDTQKGFEDVNFFRIYPVITRKGVIAEYNNGSPFLVESSLEEGKMVLMSTSFSPEWSNLALTGLLVPLVHRTTQYLAATLARFDNPRKIGESFYCVQEEEIVASNFILKKPNGQEIYITPSYREGKLAIKIENPDIAGIYEIWADSTLIDVVAVNPDVKESDMTPFNRDDISDNVEVVWVDPDEEIENVIFSARYGKELWKTFLWIVFGLMIAELALDSTWKKPKEFIEEEQKPFPKTG